MSKVKRCLANKELYASYVIKMKQKGTPALSKVEFNLVVNSIGHVMSNQILEAGIVGLPKKNGDILVRSYKLKQHRNPTRLYNTSTNVRVPVIHFNDHNDGLIKKFFWQSPDRIKSQAKIWLFAACRNLKRTFSQLLQKGKLYPDYVKLLNIK